MESSSGSLEYWRKFFRSTNSDIFDVIEKAVIVAVTDCPQEFMNRRDRIVEKFYTATLPKCSGCDRVTEEFRSGGNASEVEDCDRSVKESKVDSCNDCPEDLQRGVSNYSYDEAEALTEEIEEENQILGEVLRIKDVLINHRDASDSVLFESLRRLQLMELSVDVLKATEIGRAVNGIRKNNSKQIRHLVRTLIEGWKVLVDEWVVATAAIADNTPNSAHLPPAAAADDDDDKEEAEEGLPSPPLDEAALFATQPTSIQLSEFFDGMDDDGNLRNNGDFDKKRENGRRLLENHEPSRKHQPAVQNGYVGNRGDVWRPEPIVSRAKPQELSYGHAKSQVTTKPSMPAIADAGPGRPPKLTNVQRNVGVGNAKPQHSVPSALRKPSTVPQDKLKSSEEDSVSAKLEIAKRMLQERYQQAENAKKQRTIQVMELQDIPKQPQNNRPTMMKSRNNFKSWANGRH